jgi:hypothetical protein
MTSVFLTAHWRHITLANYAVAPANLVEFIPAGTELDTWEGEAHVSLVGFLFEKSRILGIPIPFHGSFEEVNLRFYVRRKVGDEWRRGVAFVKELVPKPAVTFVARSIYRENYATVPMSHQLHVDADNCCQEVVYTWGAGREACTLNVDLRGANDASADKRARFFADHYWGYSKLRSYSKHSEATTIEYHVTHPPWQLREPVRFELNGNVAAMYGDVFADTLAQSPQSVIFAEGSKVSVYRGQVI